jgi:hypothetical protein
MCPLDLAHLCSSILVAWGIPNHCNHVHFDQSNEITIIIKGMVVLARKTTVESLQMEQEEPTQHEIINSKFG